MTKISGIKKLCTETQSLPPKGCQGTYAIEVFLDAKTNKLSWTEHACAQNYTELTDKNMIQIGIMTHRATMDDIRAMIESRMAEYDRTSKEGID